MNGQLDTVPPGYHREGQYVVKDGQSFLSDVGKPGYGTEGGYPVPKSNLPTVSSMDMVRAHFVNLTDKVGMSGMPVKKRVVILSVLAIGGYMMYKKGLLKKVFK